MPHDKKNKNFSPSKTLIKLFLIVIFSGTFALMLPGASSERISVTDALFTATSAVCVTGLTVKETGTYFTTFGQVIILILIQMGALGYMTLASLIVLLLRKGMSIKGKLLVKQQMSGTKSVKLSKYIMRVSILTFSLEIFGALILSIRLNGRFGNTLKSVYFGIFHSVSAFCNAGFDIFGDGRSLSSMNGDYAFIITAALLIITGGIGYIVINDTYESIAALLRNRRHRMTLHTKIVLSATLTLLAAGTLLYFIAEKNNPQTMLGMSHTQKWLMAFFQSVTPRTAGFSMIKTSGLINFSIIFTIILMFIGASPGGTGGGIKTTTFAIMLTNVKSIIQEREDIFLFKRRITYSTVKNTVAIFFLALCFVVTMTLLISSIEAFSLKDILFEVTSAFGTVGLSTGITGKMSDISKLLIVVTMFFGRLGPLTIGTALLKKAGKVNYRFPEQEIAVG
ncbi:MAG: Trk family potassium uptake protein [Elusimicrobia bacterium]|nr:Trk family potassium uptake protein [Elusimicrobiota bacterium]